MREPSMVVCKASAAQFEERQTKWVYARPVVVMDVLWNLGYDPSTGIYGMDFYVALKHPSYRVGRYCRCKSRVGIQHRVTKEDAMKWFQMKHEERVILNKGQNLTSQGFGVQVSDNLVSVCRYPLERTSVTVNVF
ncbi:hypothetical protein Droror1_Dr00019737 [Drosera rotundifolia]